MRQRTTSLGILCLTLAGALAAGEPPKRFTEVVRDRDGETYRFEMVLIPGGEFTMGSPPGEKGREKHEGPQHRVRIDPFYLCTIEATANLFLEYYAELCRDDWRAHFKRFTRRARKITRQDVAGITAPSIMDACLALHGLPDRLRRRPIAAVSWLNATTFCGWLSEKTGKRYRLPTEAEWECACRADTTAAYSFGDKLDRLDQYAWFDDNDEEGMRQEVAQKKPNAWGLYDMHGNVYEWVQDIYSPAAYAANAKAGLVINPDGPDAGKAHVVRGGAFDSMPAELRSAARWCQQDDWRAGDPQEPKSVWWLPKLDIIGFRVACDLPTPSKRR